jgi:hypothetical protein
MVKPQDLKSAKPTRVMRVMYSATGLAIIGAAVAVLGAPMKW